MLCHCGDGKGFFTELSVFLNTAERPRVTAAYSQYVLERLETTLLSLSALIKFVCINGPSPLIQTNLAMLFPSVPEYIESVPH